MKRRVVAFVLSAALPASAHGQDGDAFRPYMTIRAGGAVYDNDGGIPGLELTNPSQFPFPHVSVGANINRYLGAEIAIDYAETHLGVAGVTSRVGEYASWSVLPQLRLRYPMLQDRLVPYMVGGVGVGIGGFNDRNALHQNIDISGAPDATMIGAVGAGLEYFLGPNVALGVEAKHVFGFETDIRFQGQTHALDQSQTLISGGFRVFLDDAGAPPRDATPAGGGDVDGLRGFVAFRTGIAFLPNADDNSTVKIDSVTRAHYGASAGVNLDRHWGVEVAWDYWEPELTAPGVGAVSEYALWTYLLQLRYRYPVLGDRVVPYALAGGGLGVAQVNDRRVPFETFRLAGDTHMTPIGAVGTGIEYYFNSNVAIGLESRYVFGFQNDVHVGTQSGTLANDSILVQASLRILFP
jgi:opacity protein-like surface antigen